MVNRKDDRQVLNYKPNGKHKNTSEYFKREYVKANTKVRHNNRI